MFRKLFLIAVWLNAGMSVHSQVAGCTDPLSTNYNSAATINNGTCTYPVTTYTPPVKVDPLSDSLIETSGLQMAGNSLWSFNDGGGAATLYRIDTVTNALLQRVILSGAVNIDWEDIAFDGTHFYIGDFGNNANGARTNLVIYKFPLSAIPDYHDQPVAIIPAGLVEAIHFTYSDQPQPPVASTANATKFDCEAMIVSNGKIHLFSKNWIDLSTTHYIINSTATGTYNAMPLEMLATNYLVTGADKVMGQNIIALLGYQNTGAASHFLHILSGYTADSFFAANKRRIDLPDVTVMGQAEGISFSNANYGYISNEKFTRTIGPFVITVNQKLRAFDLNNFVSNYPTVYTFTGDGNWSTAANWNNQQVPPATLSPGTEIIINPAAGGQCLLDINYTVSANAKLIISSGKNLLITGNLNIQQ